MRFSALLACTTLLLATTLAIVPSADARELFCTDLTNGNCAGTLCLDTSLDGRIQSNECSYLICGVAGCCDVCPPPQPAPPVCKELVVGAIPAYVTVGYGIGVGCVGATVTTCHLSYYPGEPNTPVWVCEDVATLP